MKDSNSTNRYRISHVVWRRVVWQRNRVRDVRLNFTHLPATKRKPIRDLAEESNGMRNDGISILLPFVPALRLEMNHDYITAIPAVNTCSLPLL